ncbi:phosphotransferase family protein [Streptomyces sp. NPDC060194]|uniref:phosphotransferase family protein n=1 Tax=Streptomyces sp. NPDC060194 TaxID=3347069 RepID=UPI0036505563
MTGTLLTALGRLAASAAHPAGPPDRACACACAAGVLADRADGTVVRHGRLVAKAHAPDSDPVALAVRVAVAAHPALTGILLPPLTPAAGAVAGRPGSVWPLGLPVDPERPEAAPWEEAARLLARLHAVPAGRLTGPLPPMRGPLKAARAMARMRAAAPHPATQDVERAWATLPAWARAEAPHPTARTLCHGDLHLGQLVRHPAPEGPWLLIDVDDLGLGDPAWDLARPAAWFAAGLLAPEIWHRFLTAYRTAGGSAVPEHDDPWPALDVPARALTAQTAALAIAKAATGQRPLDEDELLMTAACARIAAHLPRPADDVAQ